MAEHSLEVADAGVSAPIGRGFSRFYFGTAVALAVASAAMLALIGQQLDRSVYSSLMIAYALYAAGAGWAYHRCRRADFPREAAMFAAAAGALVVIGAVALVWQDGLRSPALGFSGILVCVLGVITRRGYSVILAVLAAAMLLALAALEAQGLLPAPPGVAPLVVVLAYQLLAVACGAAGGMLIMRIVQHSLRIATEREARFRGLLGMAANWYWEQDAEYRYTFLSDDPGGGPPRHDADKPVLGRRLWDLDNVGLSPEAMDAHRADLEARRPFSGLLVRRLGRRNTPHYFSVSGAPRFDADGQFTGYWGVSRDVTLEITAQQAAAASEGRYRELFTRSPSPLMLHRNGVVIDANDAAARLVGVENPAALRGFDLVTLYPDGETRELGRRRTQQLERLALGQGLPVGEMQIEALDGRRRVVQATGVRVETPSGPASLSIFFDITARVAAESALRRSETMLQMLFATSPDCITLTDVATGRYLLVNDAFTRLTGHDSTAVIGRTAHEIGIWYDPADRERLLAAIRERHGATELPITFRHKSGAPVSMLVSAALFELDGRAHLVINARDVTQTDRMRMESDAMLRNASIGIAFTRDRVFVRANPAFEQMIGWPEGGLAGQDGAVVWPDAQAYADVGRTIGPLLATGQPVEIERHVRRRDGGTLLARILAQAVDPKDPARSGTIWIAEDVTERRQIEQALAAARDAAEAASRAKSAFLANTSHEIRTPLNALLGLTRMARAAELEPARRSQYLDQIHASAKQLAGIISDILDLSKIEAGKIVIESRPFDLRVMLEAVQRNAAPIAEAKGLALSLMVDATLPGSVIGDELRLQQIVSNYVANAIKFTERGQVRVEAGRTLGGTVRITVHDSGPGIDAATQARLFRPFTQADESTTRRYGGTGLGLSICRELATLMGGEVGLSSVPGQGSTFWVDLPLAETDAVPEWAHTSDADPELLRGARVLLVEDNPVNMMIAVAMLEQWGIDVEQAGDGPAAIASVEHAAAQGRPVELVLMDVQMPGMSGHETARALRTRRSSRELPIIALTAAALVSERDEALAAGMDDFLTKPIDPGKLREALARHLLAMSP